MDFKCALCDKFHPEIRCDKIIYHTCRFCGGNLYYEVEALGYIHTALFGGIRCWWKRVRNG